MPVRKFRSVEDMNQPVWRSPGDPALYRTMAGLLATGARLRRRGFAPGVHRYRSIEDLEAAADSAPLEGSSGRPGRFS
jgi:hypothetical protein